MNGETTYTISIFSGSDKSALNQLLDSISFVDSTGLHYVWTCPSCKRYYSHQLIKRQMSEQPVCECGRELGKSWVCMHPNWNGNSAEEMLGDAISLFTHELRGCASDDDGE